MSDCSVSNSERYFAVIDTETTWDNQVMSIGITIAEKVTKEIMDSYYFIISPECEVGGMYSHVLYMPEIEETVMDDRESVIKEIDNILKRNGIRTILAYNASFDKKHLPELDLYKWCDIMRLAAYRQYNKKITNDIECCSTGKMKRGYGVEPILRMLSGNNTYRETHNAYFDAIDELKIVQLLGYDLEVYDIGIV